MDKIAKAILEAIADLGYVVTIDGGDGRTIVTARSDVEVYQAKADDLLTATYELAELTTAKLGEG